METRMAVRWSPSREAECVAEAERRAKEQFSLTDCTQGFLYRLSDHFRSDGWSWEGRLVIEIEAFPIIRNGKDSWTARVHQCYSRRRLKVVRKASGSHRWACPTPGEALESFIRRKKAQFEIHDRKADRARQASRLAQGLTKPLIDLGD
jgi:hypothetical protein